jgi:hypothetical protein
MFSSGFNTNSEFDKNKYDLTNNHLSSQTNDLLFKIKNTDKNEN